MTQITEKIQINTKDLVQLLVDNGLLDEYFINADVNNLFVSQVNNNEKVAQIEVGLNVGLDYLKAIEDEAQERFDNECIHGKNYKWECHENESNDKYLFNNMYNNTNKEIPIISFINEFAKAIEKYERGV